MRIVFTGGGTGGHVYPALAVLERLVARGAVSLDDVAWVGRPASIEQELATRQGLPFRPISTGALRGRSPLQALQSIGRLSRGGCEGRRIIREFKPDVVFSTGGYVTAPLTLAAWWDRVPVVIYLPDMEPGLAVRQLACFATRICVSLNSVAAHLPARKVLVTGYPVRQELLEADRATAREQLGLDPKGKVLLVLGGSTGAHSINQAVSSHLEALLNLGQIVHVCGIADLDELRARAETLPASLRPNYRLYGYVHEEMISALAAADLVVARAGASVLAEFPAVGLAAILVPYPYAGQHQRVNAELLAERGGAIVVDDDAIQERLLDAVRDLLGDSQRLSGMGAAMRSVSVPEAADRLVDVLVQTAGGARRG